jgi:hypothetical protein
MGNVAFRILTHPELMDSYPADLHRLFEEEWRKVLEEGKPFRAAVPEYMDRVFSLPQVREGKLKKSIMQNRIDGPIADLSTFMWPVFDYCQNRCTNPADVNEVLRDGEIGYAADCFGFGMKIGHDEGSRSGLTSTIISRIFRVAFRHAGDKTYTVADDLAWALKNTELRGVPANELRLPLPVIYFELPTGYKVYNKDTGWHEAAGVYVSESEWEGERLWRIILVGLSKDPGNPMDDAIMFYTIDLPNGVTVDSRVETILKQASFPGVPGDKWVEVRESFRQVFNFVMNAALYATHDDVDQMLSDASPDYRRLRERLFKAQGKKRGKIRAQMRQTASRPRVVLGGRVVIDRKKDDLEGDPGASQTGRRWKVRTLVRGHYRWQAHGPGRSLRKRIWIRPHYAGPQHAPLTKKVTELR